MVAVASKSRLKAAVGFASHIGRRDENQDFAAACLEDVRSHHGLVAAVADGLGGRKGGRVAAELAVRSFIDDYLSQTETLPPQKTAARALESVNYWIHRLGQKDVDLKDMACVFTGIVVKGQRLHSFHVGDTRLYRWRDQRLGQLTQDHKPAGAEDSHYVSRAIGFDEAVRIDYRVFDVLPHDRLLLCSDGLHGVINETQISAILLDRVSPEDAAQKLIDAAVAAGAEDNVTALVIDILDLPPATVEDLDALIAALPMLDPPKVGDIVDDFRLEALLSDGQFSRVFRARDLKATQTGVPNLVLLKFPKPQNLGEESQARAAFLRETWVASRVQNIWVGAVLLLPPGRQTSLYVAQPFYNGETLEVRLLREPISLTRGLEIAVKLAKAVGSLHRVGIIHRDIKPDNVILLRNGGLKLIDLGFARLPLLDPPEAFLPPGTRNYMAPELNGGKGGDERSDIFALGVTLYRMFTGGAFPYGETPAFTQAKLGRPDPMYKHRQDIPAWLESVLLQAIAPDPDDRFQDGLEMAFKLETGTFGATPPSLKKRYLERYPQRVWQLSTFVLALCVVGLLCLRYGITIERIEGWWRAAVNFVQPLMHWAHERISLPKH